MTTNRVALVTGGTRGLGKAIALGLKADGYKVAVVYHSNEAGAADFWEETTIPVFKWDVADYDACRNGITKVEGKLGAIDILVNNAGITADTVLHKMTPEQWWKVINTNLGSMFNMCSNVINGMREREFGRIINISSVNGQKGQCGQTNYAASKAGVLGFTRALALESARKNITVNAIAPGYCDTDMLAAVPAEAMKSIMSTIPVGRLGSSADIARAVSFLVKDEASFITGTTLSINGGQYIA
jgi:acetoacetyl-CoA reductase